MILILVLILIAIINITMIVIRNICYIIHTTLFIICYNININSDYNHYDYINCNHINS